MSNKCDGKCLKCRYGVLVPDPDQFDSFNSDDLSLYCMNPSNSMEKECTDVHRRYFLMKQPRIKYYVNEKKWTFISGALRPYEVDSDNLDKKFGDGVAII